jgi:hypothetical protein
VADLTEPQARHPIDVLLPFVIYQGAIFSADDVDEISLRLARQAESVN